MRLSVRKNQRRHYSGKKQRHTQKAQEIIAKKSLQIIARIFAKGRTHNFRLFNESKLDVAKDICCLADTGYQGLMKLHSNSKTPFKNSKHHPCVQFVYGHDGQC